MTSPRAGLLTRRRYYGIVRIRIVVLNWNGRAWLDGCLSALETERTRDVEILVVDNGSHDGSLEFVRDRFPWVQVLALDANVGFARGNNLGARGADGEFLVFLNNDTRVAAGWLAALVAEADADQGVGLVTSRVVFLDPPGVIDSAGDGYLRCGGGFKIRHGRPADEASASREVFGACGAAFLIRRELFERLGGFDERFFMVYEDVDLSYRARLAGARVMYAANATVGHAGSASIGRASPQAVYYGQRNLEWTWIQNSPTRLLWRSAGSHALYALAAGVVFAINGQVGPWFRGKMAALWGLPGALAARRVVQAAAVADAESLWRLMDADWIQVKRREKRFDFGRRPTSDRSPRSPES